MWWVMKQSTMQNHSKQKSRISSSSHLIIFIRIRKTSFTTSYDGYEKVKKPAAKSLEMRTNMYKRNSETKLPLSKHSPLWIHADGLAIKMHRVSVSCACSP